MQTVLILSKAGDFHCRLFVTSVDSVLISKICKILSIFIYQLQSYLSSGSPAWWAGHGSSILCNTINFLCLIWVSSSIYRLVLQLGGQNKEPQYLGVSILCMLFNYTIIWHTHAPGPPGLYTRDMGILLQEEDIESWTSITTIHLALGTPPYVTVKIPCCLYLKCSTIMCTMHMAPWYCRVTFYPLLRNGR